MALAFVVLLAPAGAVMLALTVSVVSGRCLAVPASLSSGLNGGQAAAVPAVSGGWVVTGATEDPTYAGGAYQQYYNGGLSYAELGATPGYANYVGGLLARALGLLGGRYGLPGGFSVLVRPVGSHSAGIRILKSDIGSGQPGDPRYTIDLHPRIAALLHFDGKQDIEVKASGDPGAPPAGSSPGGTCAGSASAGVVAGSGTYRDPFAHSAVIVPNRIDMGVDYDGVGAIDALGDARVTFAATGIGGGWVCSTDENGGVVYQLEGGPDRGRFVYVTEDVIPTVVAGQQVSAGQQVATFAPAGGRGCIETGFSSQPAPEPEAAVLGQQAAGDPGSNRTYCGQSMSDLLASTGAPPGLGEGKPVTGQSC